MNERERFGATMHYRPRDRSPIMDFNFWDETLFRWRQQGLPQWVDGAATTGFFGMDALDRRVVAGGFKATCDTPSGPLVAEQGLVWGLLPAFDEKLIEDRGDHEVVQQGDGNIAEPVPLWLDAGVNCMLPFEVGTWGADPIEYRKQYGKDLLMLGGFDKRILASNKEAIEEEVHRLTPLVEEGGYIGFCDHAVPPDVPLENYMFYLRTVREVWGLDKNLKPMHPEAARL